MGGLVKIGGVAARLAVSHFETARLTVMSHIETDSHSEIETSHIENILSHLETVHILDVPVILAVKNFREYIVVTLITLY